MIIYLIILLKIITDDISEVNEDEMMLSTKSSAVFTVRVTEQKEKNNKKNNKANMIRNKIRRENAESHEKKLKC